MREKRSLIQTCGRAARNVHGRVIMYADRITKSMKFCMDETARRRGIQQAYNEEHGITPRSTKAAINPLEADEKVEARASGRGKGKGKGKVDPTPIGLGEIPDSELLPAELTKRVAELRETMSGLAKELRYEEAARVRDRVRVLEARLLEVAS